MAQPPPQWTWTSRAATPDTPRETRNVPGFPLAEFPRFSKLPSELQDLIWDRGVSDSVVITINITKYDCKIEGQLPDTPSIMLATAGSRAIAMNRYTLMKNSVFKREKRPTPPAAIQNLLANTHGGLNLNTIPVPLPFAPLAVQNATNFHTQINGNALWVFNTSNNAAPNPGPQASTIIPVQPAGPATIAATGTGNAQNTATFNVAIAALNGTAGVATPAPPLFTIGTNRAPVNLQGTDELGGSSEVVAVIGRPTRKRFYVNLESDIFRLHIVGDLPSAYEYPIALLAEDPYVAASKPHSTLEDALSRLNDAYKLPVPLPGNGPLPSLFKDIGCIAVDLKLPPNMIHSTQPRRITKHIHRAFEQFKRVILERIEKFPNLHQVNLVVPAILEEGMNSTERKRDRVLFKDMELRPWRNCKYKQSDGLSFGKTELSLLENEIYYWIQGKRCDEQREEQRTGEKGRPFPEVKLMVSVPKAMAKENDHWMVRLGDLYEDCSDSRPDSDYGDFM